MATPLIIPLPLDDLSDLPMLTEQQSVEFVCTPPVSAALTLTLDGLALEPFLHPGDPSWRWRWQTGAAPGGHTLQLTITEAAESRRIEWRLQVLPGKMDVDRYLALLDDLEVLTPRLAHALAGGGTAAAAVPLAAPALLFDDAALLFGDQFEVFEQAVLRIQAQPRNHPRRAVTAVPLGQAHELPAESLRRAVEGDLEVAPPDAAADLQRAIHPAGGFLPRQSLQARAADTADTAEHRLLKHVLGMLRGRARHIAAAARNETARLSLVAPNSPRAARARALEERCVTCARRLDQLLAAPWLAEVSPLRQTPSVTPLLRRDPAYRQIFQMWRRLQQQLLVTPGAPFDLTVADLPLLYERWCTLQLIEALLNLGAIPQFQRILTIMPGDNATLGAISLPADTPLLSAQWGEALLTLRYQPRYRPGAPSSAGMPYSLDRHTRIPDMAIEISSGGSIAYLLIFDAKYRLDPDGRGVPVDALAEAYAYAGAIGISGVSSVRSAFLLYPGIAAPERYPGGVGAIPLLPGDTTVLEAALLAELPARE